MLRAYLYQWFMILGTSPKFRGKDLWYIDGFAGPGEYTNGQQGSPIAAMLAAQAAFTDAGSRWLAKDIRCLFIEEGRARCEHLKGKLAESQTHPRIHSDTFHGNFIDGIGDLQTQTPNPFSNVDPTFAFVDPLGPSGLSFNRVRDLLSRPACEVLVNLDSDGVNRIYAAGEHANYRERLDEVFGDSEWKQDLSRTYKQHDAVRKVLALYKRKLRSLPGVRYVFSFEMRKQKDVFDYHLVFASQHPKGLTKMKEVMKTIDQTGSYCFSDGSVNQPSLFTFDDPSFAAAQMLRHFAGNSVSYADVNDYALNESPFINAKSMLRLLEKNAEIAVHCEGRTRIKGTFPDKMHDVIRIQF